MDRPSSLTGGPEAARVAVIGAGYAGLAAAVRLQAAGLRPEVFESGAEPGGRARRVHAPEGVLDNGLHIGIGAYTRLLAISAEVGAGAAWLRRPLDWRIGHWLRLRAAPLPAPLHLLVGLALARGLPAGARLQAAWLVARLRAARWQVRPDTGLPNLLDRLRQGPAIRERLWYPLCVAALNTPPSSASAQVFANVLRDSLGAERGASDLLLPRVDLTEAFPGPAVRWLQARGARVHLRTRVLRVIEHESGRGWQPITAPGVAPEGANPAPFDAVILAVAPRALAHLTQAWPALAPVHATAAALAHEPITSLYLGYPGAPGLPAPMVGLEGGPGQWAFDRGALSGQAGVIGVVISASTAERASGTATLADEVHRQLAALLPGLPPPRWQRVITERMATFACTPGLDRVGLRTAAPGVFIAGDHVRSDWPATLEGAVRSGEAAAAAVVDWLGIRSA